MGIARVLGVVLFAAGVVLLVFGINSTDTLTEKAVEKTTGKYTDETMWYIIGGVVCAVAGVAIGVRRK